MTGETRTAARSVEERPQRLHRYAGRLLASLDDVTRAGIGGVALGCLDAEETAETVLELGTVIARLEGLRLAVLAHGDAIELARNVAGPAAGDTAGWLTATALIHARAAHAEVRLAEDLSDRFRATADALLGGRLDAAQARAVVQAVNRLPDRVEVDDRARAERHMLQEAGRLDAVQLRVIGRRLLEVVDPEGAEAEEARRLQAEADVADARTSLSMWDDGTGTTNVWAKLPTSHGVMLHKALHAIANPQLADPISRTEQTQPQVMGQALCRLLETIDPEDLPSSGGLNAAVVVTMSLETLRGGLGAATLDSGDRLSPGEARRMACAAGVIPAVLGSRGQLLDLGRRARLYTKPQRVAMAVQQGFTCAVERCGRPTAWADAHHLDGWAKGGRTDVADGVLLCGRHHTLVHHPDYLTQRLAPGRISLTRAPRSAPRRQ